jgi:hypothetical protein
MVENGALRRRRRPSGAMSECLLVSFGNFHNCVICPIDTNIGYGFVWEKLLRPSPSCAPFRLEMGPVLQIREHLRPFVVSMPELSHHLPKNFLAGLSRINPDLL